MGESGETVATIGISFVLQDRHDQYEMAATSEQEGKKKKKKKKDKETDMDDLKKEVDMVSDGQVATSCK